MCQIAPESVAEWRGLYSRRNDMESAYSEAGSESGVKMIVIP